MNRLADEPSPYLRQHADNPVDWWPWCDEAFEEARRRDVPVFLSIGYATCHWCHVMAHESFEDDDVAAAMNEAFVCIKVDREERPDIDAAYMAVCQAMNGSGGWPLTALLDADRQAWFTGTYFPKTARGRRIGMTELIPRLSQAWQEDRASLLHQAEHLIEHLQRPTPGDDAVEADVTEVAERAAASLLQRFDREHGGYGAAPKFPSPHQMRLLLRHDEADRLASVAKTLHAMADGGIHDQVGGGFHRYSTDARWRVPHFEKMLYDQATLLDAYREAWQRTGQRRFREVAADIVAYVLRDLRRPGGAFACAEDADSEGEEGTFYVWTRAELEEILGPDAEAFAAAFDVQPDGNWHDESTGQPMPTNILIRRTDDDHGDALQRLLVVRSQRTRPLLDDKILTDWNGLWIQALARAGSAFDEPEWIDAAAKAARFLLREMIGDDRLHHRWHSGRRDDVGFLDDHAFLGLASIALYEATLDPSWLQHAVRVAGWMRDRFETSDGGFALRARDGERLPVERLDGYDGAMPSGNSAAFELLWRLGRITGDPEWELAADGIWRRFSAELEAAPIGFTALLATALDRHRAKEVVVTGSGQTAKMMLARMRREFRPDVVLVTPAAASVAAWLNDYPAGKDAAYVCRDHACQAPVYDDEALAASLSESPSLD